MSKYKNSFVAMHWLHAVLISFLLIGATLKMPDLPAIGGDLSPYKMHIALGVLATLMVIVRLIMLRSQPKLQPLKVGELRQSIIKWNHRLIYIFLLLVGISGFATAKAANIGGIVWFGRDAADYTGPDGIVNIFASIHSTSSTILMILIVMHIAGVVSYKLKTGEPIMKRMWF